MNARLRVDSVRAERFGGLTNVELSLPPAPMVVIHGSNETGKSTLSELIAWLLVGPASDGNVIRRFGVPDEVLAGSLTGSLRGEEFSASAKFKVTPGGGSIATASKREYRLGTLLTPEQWRQHIGGVDLQTLAGIYRLWGQQLHEGGDADAELRRAGLGALAGAADPRDLAKKFELEARPGTKAGPGSSSFGSVMSELDGVATSIREADRNVDDYRSAQSEWSRLEAQRREISQQSSELQAHRSLLERAGQLDEVRSDEAEKRDRLAKCETVPEKWKLVLDDLPAVKSAIERCRDARVALHDHEIEFGKRVAGAGIAEAPGIDAVLERITITTHDTATIATAVAEVAHAGAAVATADQARRGLLTARSGAFTDLDSALEVISADENTLRNASLDLDSQLQLVKLSDNYNTARTGVEESRGRLDGAQAELVEAELALQFALEGWDRFGVSVGPSEWLGRSDVDGSDTPLAGWLMLVGVIVTFGVVAAVLGQWILVILALVAVLISVKGKPERAVTTRSTELVEAASRVADAERARDAAKVAVARHAEEIKAAQQRVIEIAADLPRLSHGFGIHIPDDPLKLQGSLDRWVEARKCLETYDSIETEVGMADAKLIEERESESAKLEDLDGLLTGLGLPGGLAPEAVESVATSHVDVVVAARSVARHRSLLVEANQQLSEVMSSVETEIESWSLDRLSSQVDLLTDRLSEFNEAASASESATKVVKALVGDDLAFRELLDEGMAPDVRATEIQRITAEIAAAAEEIDEISEQLGRVADRLEEVRRAERLADLRVREGSLMEARDDLALEAASRRLAGLLLRSVADDYEQKNQPQLVKRTGELAAQVADRWKAVVVKPSDADTTTLHVRMTDGDSSGVFDVAALSLSTGARALLYLALRLSMAEQDGQKRGLDLPLLCDDPLVHLDDDRAQSAVQLLIEAANRRQILLFTCHQRTVDVATNAGAELVRLGSAD